MLVLIWIITYSRKKDLDKGTHTDVARQQRRTETVTDAWNCLWTDHEPTVVCCNQLHLYISFCAIFFPLTSWSTANNALWFCPVIKVKTVIHQANIYYSCSIQSPTEKIEHNKSPVGLRAPRGEHPWWLWRHCFRKIPFSNCFRPHCNGKAAFSHIPGLNSVFKKLCFRWTLSFSRLVWMIGGITFEMSCVSKFFRPSVDRTVSHIHTS